ncbi:MAG: hypothetical protein JW904_01205 [Spirochaetales bacterium]|nr:hypothetical protein [Spirochaetales bacterium]
MKLYVRYFLMMLLFQFFQCSLLPVNSAPVELIPVYKGDGSIYDIKTGGQITIPEQKLLNILILPEGYTQEDLDNKKFDRDVETWMNETSVVEPFLSFKNAFVVWQYNTASKEHVVKGGGKKQTAFGITVDASGELVLEFDEAARKVWEIGRKTNILRDDFYPPGGITGYLNMNLIVVILTYDPQLDRSGYSGCSRRLANPQNNKQLLSTAISHNRPHEFLHAFARLGDEYLAENPGNDLIANAQSETSRFLYNVVKDPDYRTVPWRHLFAGGEINKDVGGVVGIYGNAINGYHSEAKCLMNGTKDNAQVYGGNGNLRVTNRLCNWCREITVFRLYERLHVFKDPSTAFAIWIKDYRLKFYRKFGFMVPEVIPQVNSNGAIIPEVSR